MLSAKETDRLHSWKSTQGHEKMLRYIDDLVRNKNFRKDIKKLRQSWKKRDDMFGGGAYYSWKPEQRKKHDEMNDSLHSIIQGYELLRKRCKKLLRDKVFKQEEKIAFNYALDLDLIWLAVTLMDETKEYHEIAIAHPDPVDMCFLTDLHEDELSPFNKGEEIIYLNLRRHLRIAAYPVAICLNQRASKRDVLDYVEKRWDWIEGMRSNYREKVLKNRKRKHNQKMIDYIWNNKAITPKKLKEKLDKEFPKNGLVYYEISKIITTETQRRNKDI
jgi:hypothetical protein